MKLDSMTTSEEAKVERVTRHEAGFNDNVRGSQGGKSDEA